MTDYRQIRDDLRDAILAGQYPVGTVIPREIDLAKTYGVGRSTAHHAVAALRAEGLVAPVKRRGTVVRDRSPVRLDIERYASVLTPGPGGGPWETACEQQGIDGHTEVLTVDQREPDSTTASLLDLPASTLAVYRLAHMYVRDVVAHIQETWLPTQLIEGTVLTNQEKVVGGIYRALTAIGHPPATADETVIARMPTRDEADTMQLDLGSPVLDTTRITRNHTGRVLVVTHAIAVGDRVQLSYHQQFSPQEGTRHGRPDR